MASVQSVFTAYGEDYRALHGLSHNQSKAMAAITHCRTSIMGGHRDVCDECGHIEVSYNSCRNRHCPRCQSFAKEKWIDARTRDLLDIHYFHTVFTLPAELASVVYQNQQVCYSLLFKAASETLLELCAEKRYMGAVPGITCVLHTWGQNLSFHPHLHCIVTGGGLRNGVSWMASRKRFLLPVKVMSALFRGKYLAYLTKEKLEFYGEAKSLADPEAFSALLSTLYAKDWVVFTKAPFGDATKVISYLGRYTHRVAISDNRIISDQDGEVSFKWRDYADDNKEKVMVLRADEFIRRVLMHVLPQGFTKIRHFGILAPRAKKRLLAISRALTDTDTFGLDSTPDTRMLLVKILGEDFDLCPACGSGHLLRASPYRHN